jgi:uncharacterized protein (TIGR04255 family)
MTRPRDLPDFAKPPVAEVVLGIQFEDLVGLRHIDLGALYAVFRERYPLVSEQLPLSPEFEMFGLPGLPSHPQLRMVFGTPIPRLWFESETKTYLLQFQANRFIFNWRRAVGIDYPRYEWLRSKFEEECRNLENFLTEFRLPSLSINQCEVTYINVIPIEEGEVDPTSRIFRFWNSSPSASLGGIDDVSLNARYVFRDRQGRPFSRLTANVTRGLDGGGAQVIQFGLTVRGKPAEINATSALEFFDSARDKIVRGFKDLTTTRMHKIWGVRE